MMIVHSVPGVRYKGAVLSRRATTGLRDNTAPL